MAKNCLINGNTDGVLFKSKESKVMAAQLMFTEKQANAILDMRLYKLIGLELQALIKEHEETMSNIYRYEDILARKDSMTQVIINDLEQIKKEFARPRRTVIDNCSEAVIVEEKIEEVPVIFLMDRFGYVKTIDEGTYERNKEAVQSENRFIIASKNTGKICIFTDSGQLHTIKLLDVPGKKFREKGIPIDNLSNYNASKEQIVHVSSQTELNLYRMVFVTKSGMIKMVDGGEFDVTKKTVAATKLADNDTVVSVVTLVDQKYMILQTKDGYFSRFLLEEVPEKKKGAIGVRGMKLTGDDTVEEVYYTMGNDEQSILYKDKRIFLNQLKLLKRDTKGVKIRV